MKTNTANVDDAKLGEMSMTLHKPKSTEPKPTYLETMLPPELVIKRMHDLLASQQYSAPHNPRPQYQVRSQKILDHYAFEVQVLSYNQHDVLRYIRGEVRELDIGRTIVEFDDPPPTQVSVFYVLAGLSVGGVVFLSGLEIDWGGMLPIIIAVFAGLLLLGGIISLLNSGTKSSLHRIGMVDVIDPHVDMIKTVIQPRNEDRPLIIRIKQAQREQMSETTAHEEETKIQIQ